MQTKFGMRNFSIAKYTSYDAHSSPLTPCMLDILSLYDACWVRCKHLKAPSKAFPGHHCMPRAQLHQAAAYQGLGFLLGKHLTMAGGPHD